MGFVYIKRGGEWQDIFRSYSVVLDGQDVEKLRRNSVVELEIRQGYHTLQLKVDWLGSERIAFFSPSSVAAIFECGPGPSKPTDIAAGRAKGPYIGLMEKNGEAVARGFIREALSQLLHQRDGGDAVPQLQGQLKLSLGDMSVLQALTREVGANAITQEGSANHLLWNKLEQIGWMKEAPTQPFGPGSKSFGVTEYGRIELVELLC